MLKWEQPLEKLKQRLASGERVFEDMVEKLLLNNPHRLFLATPADVEDDMAGRFARDEQRRVSDFKQANSDLTLAGIILPAIQISEVFMIRAWN